MPVERKGREGKGRERARNSWSKASYCTRHCTCCILSIFMIVSRTRYFITLSHAPLQPSSISWFCFLSCLFIPSSFNPFSKSPVECRFGPLLPLFQTLWVLFISLGIKGSWTELKESSWSGLCFLPQPQHGPFFHPTSKCPSVPCSALSFDFHPQHLTSTKIELPSHIPIPYSPECAPG